MVQGDTNTAFAGCFAASIYNRKFFVDKIAKWWIPDDVVFIEEIPHTATGKIKKTALRDQFSDYKASE